MAHFEKSKPPLSQHSSYKLNPHMKQTIGVKLRYSHKHSYWVGLSRVAVPFMAIAILFTMIYLILTVPPTEPLLQQENTQTATPNDDIVITAPILNGIGENGMPYSFQAQRAIQKADIPNQLFLETLSGVMNKGGDESVLHGNEALYFRDKKQLNILSVGRYLTSDGGVALFPTAQIYNQTNIIFIDNGLSYQSPSLSVKADKGNIDYGEKIYFFEGRVHTLLHKGGKTQ